MTIYTKPSGEKKENSDNPPPEVVTEALLDWKKKEEVLPVPLPVILSHAHSLQARRRRAYARFCILLICLIILTTGLIGAFFIYKRITHRTFQGWCGVQYYEMTDAEQQFGERIEGQKVTSGHFEQGMELDRETGKFEKFDVPKFVESRKAVILHDFEKNNTAIIDKENARCFVMPLNRTMVKPPKDFWDLILKMKTGYYLPDERIVRQNFVVKTPPVTDLSRFGVYILEECHFFDTYELVSAGSEQKMKVKRDVVMCEFAGTVYPFTGAAGTDKMGIANLVGCVARD